MARPERKRNMPGREGGFQGENKNCGRQLHRAAMLAESEGFEPSVPVTQYGSLANCWFQPLTHDSGSMAGGGL
jgi:hypothetical protein